MTDDIIARMRDWQDWDGERLTSPSYPLPLTLSDAADEIERLRGLVAELLPAALHDAEQGILCRDCKWYSDSVAFMERYNSGYYSID